MLNNREVDIDKYIRIQISSTEFIIRNWWHVLFVSVHVNESRSFQ